MIAAVFYWVSGLGITIGYHRYFTHSSFKAKTGLRVAMAIAGSLAMEGPVVTWVADHRRHHKYSDKEGDPHSPWRYGDDAKALAKGLLWAHVLWLFDENQTAKEKFAPDLIADRRSTRSTRWFPGIVAFTLHRPRASSAASGPRPASGRGTAPSRRSSGPAWSASPCCTT